MVRYNFLMCPAYQKEEADEPHLAIRRHTDRCFHRVEEVVPDEGYIVDGILIPLDEVAQLVELDDEGAPLPPCDN